VRRPKPRAESSGTSARHQASAKRHLGQLSTEQPASDPATQPRPPRTLLVIVAARRRRRQRQRHPRAPPPSEARRPCRPSTVAASCRHTSSLAAPRWWDALYSSSALSGQGRKTTADSRQQSLLAQGRGARYAQVERQVGEEASAESTAHPRRDPRRGWLPQRLAERAPRGSGYRKSRLATSG